jgi:hypothetical protein
MSFGEQTEQLPSQLGLDTPLRLERDQYRDARQYGQGHVCFAERTSAPRPSGSDNGMDRLLPPRG